MHFRLSITMYLSPVICTLEVLIHMETVESTPNVTYFRKVKYLIFYFFRWCNIQGNSISYCTSFSRTWYLGLNKEPTVRLSDERIKVTSYIADTSTSNRRNLYEHVTDTVQPPTHNGTLINEPYIHIKRKNTTHQTQTDTNIELFGQPSSALRLKVLPESKTPLPQYTTTPWPRTTPTSEAFNSSFSNTSYSINDADGYNHSPSTTSYPPTPSIKYFSNTVYQPLPIKTINQNNSVGISHRGTPIKIYNPIGKAEPLASQPIYVTINTSTQSPKFRSSSPKTTSPAFTPESYVTISPRPIPSRNNQEHAYKPGNALKSNDKLDIVSRIPPLNSTGVALGESILYSEDMVSHTIQFIYRGIQGL